MKLARLAAIAVVLWGAIAPHAIAQSQTSPLEGMSAQERAAVRLVSFRTMLSQGKNETMGNQLLWMEYLNNPEAATRQALTVCDDLDSMLSTSQIIDSISMDSVLQIRLNDIGSRYPTSDSRTYAIILFRASVLAFCPGQSRALRDVY